MSLFSVAAVASSAGGLDLMKSFFHATPHDSIVYVILRHMPVDYVSGLHAILKDHTWLQLLEITNNMELMQDIRPKSTSGGCFYH